VNHLFLVLVLQFLLAGDGATLLFRVPRTSRERFPTPQTAIAAGFPTPNRGPMIASLRRDLSQQL
jgi:hypothetical protein